MRIIREMYAFAPLVFILLSGFGLFLILMICDIAFAREVPFVGKVVDKQYKAASSRTGTDFVTNSNGSISTVVTSESESEKFLLMVQEETGEIKTVESSSEVYYKKQVGEWVECYWQRGDLSGLNWGNHTAE